VVTERTVKEKPLLFPEEKMALPPKAGSEAEGVGPAELVQL